MKGKNHLRMGACTVAVVSCAGVLPWFSTPLVVGAGVGVFLFGKVAPDLDHPTSSITRSWGWASRAFAWLVIRLFARWIYLATRTKHDPVDAAVHRGFTHTVPGAALAGVLAFWTVLSGPWATALALGLAVGGAARVYDRDWKVWVALGFGAVGYLAWPELLPAAPWLGFALAVGCVAHSVDDCVTTYGAPLAFPFVNEDGKRWARVGPPEWARFDTGGPAETAVVWGVILVTSYICYRLAIEPWIGPRLVETFGGVG